jgi:hypothetical protein
MVSAAKIREHVVKFLGHQESLNDFDDWFTRYTWDTHLNNDPEVDRLVGAVELALAEHSSKQLDDRELDAQLCSLVQFQSATIPLGSRAVDTPFTAHTTALQDHYSEVAVAA